MVGRGCPYDILFFFIDNKKKILLLINKTINHFVIFAWNQ